MEKDVKDSFDLVNAVAPDIAKYVEDHRDQWDLGEEGELPISKSSEYADGLVQVWPQLSRDERQAFFDAIEKMAAWQAAEPNTENDVGMIWCTGFLESLCVQVDEGRLPLQELMECLGQESLEYINAWNKFGGWPIWERPKSE